MKNFIDLACKMSAIVVDEKLTPDEQTAVATGNVLAEQFIDAVRTDALPPDAIVHAIYMVVRSGPEAASTLRGFLQRITEELKQ